MSNELAPHVDGQADQLDAELARLIGRLTEPCPNCEKHRAAANQIETLLYHCKFVGTVQGPEGEGHPRVTGDLINSLGWRCGKCGGKGRLLTKWGKALLLIVRELGSQLPTSAAIADGEIPF